MKKIRNILAAALLLIIMVSQPAYAYQGAIENMIAGKVEDMPGQWALLEIRMADILGIGAAETYQAYTAPIDADDYARIQASLEAKFAVVDETKITGQNLTRAAVIKELYDIISLSLTKQVATASEQEVLQYFVDHGLLNGRDNGDYSLDQVCTNQEMILLAQRVYQYLAYELGLDGKGMFWQVSDEDNTVNLLGSIHVTDGSVYPLSKEIVKAYEQSDRVVVEVNVGILKPEDITYLQKISVLDGDKTIDQLISAETYQLYAARAEELGMKPEIYNKFKPWYAAMVTQTTGKADSDLKASLGIDVYFLGMAQGVKPIDEVEGLKFQLDLFDSFSPELQEAYLSGTLKGEQQSSQTIKQMIDSWRVGDAKQLEKYVFETGATSDLEKEFVDKLFEQRNKHMTEYVKKMLDQDSENDYFFIVGAGHMIGDEGIVEELRKAGYTVEQVK